MQSDGQVKKIHKEVAVIRVKRIRMKKEEGVAHNGQSTVITDKMKLLKSLGR